MSLWLRISVNIWRKCYYSLIFIICINSKYNHISDKEDASLIFFPHKAVTHCSVEHSKEKSLYYNYILAILLYYAIKFQTQRNNKAKTTNSIKLPQTCMKHGLKSYPCCILKNLLARQLFVYFLHFTTMFWSSFLFTHYIFLTLHRSYLERKVITIHIINWFYQILYWFLIHKPSFVKNYLLGMCQCINHIYKVSTLLVQNETSDAFGLF